MKRILWISDAVIPTGFSRVAHSIIDALPEDEYEIHHIGINYWGDPHAHKHRIYPASLGGDVYGLGRLEKTFSDRDFDLIFILNDLYVINLYLEKIKNTFKKVPPIVTYFPIDGNNANPSWFSNFDIVSQPVAYTEFGKQTCLLANKSLNIKVIPHGVNTKIFFPLEKAIIKKQVFKHDKEINTSPEDSFIVLNVNRNQPRKRLDIALQGFCLFAMNKPPNVKYYHHAGTQDVGWDVFQLLTYLSRKYGEDFSKRLIVSNMNSGPQTVPDNVLNMIYNSADVGLNTSLGEGWGLPSVEHAVTRAAQIVPNHSACTELFSDCGLLIPVTTNLFIEKVNTEGGLVTPEDVAIKLEKLYIDKEYRDNLANASYEKFSGESYSWENIALQWHDLFQNTQ